MYHAIDIAKYVISYCNESGKSISNLKLQKILYFIQADFLVTYSKPCFYNDIEAWDYGPVVPDVYHYFKIYGGSSIILSNSNPGLGICQHDKELIHEMVEQCIDYTASELVDITHNQAPWTEVYVKNKNNVITTDSIQSYFKEE